MNTKKLIIPVLSLFMLVGCIDPVTEKPEPASVEKIDKFKVESNITKFNIIDDKTFKNLICDSGEFHILESMPIEYKFEQCKKEGLVVNGSFVAFNGYTIAFDDLNLSFENNHIIEEDVGNIEVYKGSYIHYDFMMREDINLATLLIDMQTTINGYKLNLNNLKIELASSSCEFMSELEDCMEEISMNVLSGSLDVDKMHFSLDKTYTENKIILTEIGLRDDASIHLLDSEGHKVELAVERAGVSMKENYLVLKIDANGDGHFSSDEITKLEE